MPDKTRFDISSENFDLYFAEQIPRLTHESKDGLPRDVLFKLFKKGGAFNTSSTSKLNFIAKLYILVKCLRKRWFIIVEDEEFGMKLSDFNDLPRLIKERDLSVDSAEHQKESGGFILGAKELMDGFSYLNRVSNSGAYNYLMKIKNMPKNKAAESDKEAAYIVKFLANWEGQKKEIVSKSGLNIPEILVLMALYHGKEVQGATLYHDFYKRAYQSSPTKIKAAFRSLQQRGFIHKYGDTSAAKMQITALGKDFLRGMLHKYVVNC